MNPDVIEYFVVNRRSRNRGIIAAFGRWPWATIRHRGWGDPVTRRAMTPEEVAANRQRHRYHSLTYRTLDRLLEDERAVLLPDFAERYHELAKALQLSPAVKLFELDHRPLTTDH